MAVVAALSRTRMRRHHVQSTDPQLLLGLKVGGYNTVFFNWFNAFLIDLTDVLIKLMDISLRLNVFSFIGTYFVLMKISSISTLSGKYKVIGNETCQQLPYNIIIL